MYTAIVITTASYACETWKRTAMMAHRLDVFHRRCLRAILGISWRDHVTNEEVTRRAGMERLQDINCYNKKMEKGWPRSQTAERMTSPHSYVLGARRRQTKEGEAKEDMTKHLQRRPRRDGCQLAWSPPDRSFIRFYLFIKTIKNYLYRVKTIQ